MNTIKCPGCGNTINENEPKCKYCGSDNPFYAEKGGEKKEQKVLIKPAEEKNRKCIKHANIFGTLSLILYGGSWLSPFVMTIVISLFVLVGAFIVLFTLGLGLIVILPIFAVLLIIFGLSPLICSTAGIVFGAVGLKTASLIENDRKAHNKAFTLSLIGLVLNISFVVLLIVATIVSAITNPQIPQSIALLLI